MAARTSAATKSAKRELIITRILDAPPALVFKAWTEPDRLVRWWGPQGYTTTFCKMDVRPGGTFRTCMRSPEGTDHWVQGVYREIVEPERLVFTWAWDDEKGKPGHETIVTLTFVAHGRKTELTLRQGVFESVKARDAHQGGWTSSFVRLAEYVAKA